MEPLGISPCATLLPWLNCMKITFEQLEKQRAEILARKDQAYSVLRQAEGALALLDVLLDTLNKPEEE